MGEGIDEKRINFLQAEKINLEKFDCRGRILDIGGGGEGIIARRFGERVIAIDLSREELEEVPVNNALRIEMDARDLKFLDEEFPAVTSFFSFMYMTPDDQNKIIQEIFRVMKADGEFYLWDIEIKPHDGGEKDVIALELTVIMDGEEIKTGYGVYWPGKEQSPESIVKMGKKAGFRIVEVKEKANSFFVKMKK